MLSLVLLAAILVVAYLLLDSYAVARFNFRRTSVQYKKLAPITMLIEAHNNAETIEDCLQAVQAITYSKYSVVIIDHASEDDSVQLVKQFQRDHPKVKLRLVARKTAANRVRALRDAINKYGRGEYIVHLSANEMITPGTLSQATQYYKVHPEAHFLYGEAILTHIATVGTILYLYRQLFVNRHQKVLQTITPNKTMYTQGLAVCRRSAWSVYTRSFNVSQAAVKQFTYVQTLGSQPVMKAVWPALLRPVQSSRPIILQATTLITGAALYYLTYIAVALHHTSLLLATWLVFTAVTILAIIDAYAIQWRQKAALLLGLPLAFLLLYLHPVVTVASLVRQIYHLLHMFTWRESVRKLSAVIMRKPTAA